MHPDPQTVNSNHEMDRVADIMHNFISSCPARWRFQCEMQ